MVFSKTLTSEKAWTYILATLYAFGIGFHLYPFLRTYMLPVTEIMLLAGGSIVLYYVSQGINRPKKFYVWALSTFVLTILVEIVGVSTAKIFGSYQYGETFRAKIYGVPFIIGLNWVILILATHSLSLAISRISWLRPFIAAALILIFDWFMEPVAQKLDYWVWQNHHIPVKNFLAWGILTLIFSSFLEIFRIQSHALILRIYFFAQLIFFIVLYVFL